jgi:hypothetical protein
VLLWLLQVHLLLQQTQQQLLLTPALQAAAAFSSVAVEQPSQPAAADHPQAMLL